MKRGRFPGKELTLGEAAELLGVTPGELAGLLFDAGIAGSEDERLRLGAKEVLAFRDELDEKRRRNQQELTRLGATLDE